jgi:hypothetical protein
MAKRKRGDPIPRLVVAARLMLAKQMGATTGQRAVAFLAAAAAEFLSMDGTDLGISQHSERFATHLERPEVKIGNALGDAAFEVGPLFVSSLVMRIAKNSSGAKEIMIFDGKEFDRNEPAVDDSGAHE